MNKIKKIDLSNINVRKSVGQLAGEVKLSVSKAAKKLTSSDAYRRPLAIAIAAALIISAAGAGTCSIVSAHRTKTIQAMRAYVDSADLQEQDETVYVIADADGGVKKVIVSDWQKDSSKNKTITDVTSLEELEKSDAENGYSINADTANSWEADGTDSYFQNVSTGESLPIDVKLSYSLDGKKMTANEIAGKSGKVTIRFDYTNNQKQTVSIDNQKTDIYVPFTVVTGTILDGASFKNVEVSNGKVINDGSRSIVMGFALPGMQESLGLDSDAVDLPDYIEITADVTNFELTTTLTMVSNDFFNKAVEEADEKKHDSNLSLDSLSDGINQLVDGSAALYDGTSQLLDKSGQLIEGINQLANGGKELRDGVITLNAGLHVLCSNSSSLDAGFQQLFNGVAESTQSGLNKLAAAFAETPYAPLFSFEITRSTYPRLATVISTLEGSIIPSIEGQIAQGEQTIQYLENLQNNPQLQKIQQHSETAALQDAEDAIMPLEEETTTTTQNTESAEEQIPDTTLITEEPQDSVTEPAQPTEHSEEQTDASAEPPASSGNETDTLPDLAQIRRQVEGAKLQLATLTAGRDSLEQAYQLLDGINTLWSGIEKYTGGVQSAANGADQLQEGAAQLSIGLDQLQSGSDALVDGIRQLNDGAMQLSEGMQQLNGSNLAKLLGASSGVNLSDVNARFDAMRDVSAAYNSYTGSTKDGGSVKFIYRTDSISADSSK